MHKEGSEISGQGTSAKTAEAQAGSGRYAALDSVRIGCVQYLNAKPLIWGYPGHIRLDHPSGLARDIARGEIDAALVPVFEALRDPHYLLVDGAAIACDGPVYSVFLAYRGELSKIRTVSLDPASLTSVHLLQVLLAEFHQLRPQYVRTQDISGETDAQLLIGNQAIEYRTVAPSDVRFLDLGEEWIRQTGLPFVFALWLLRRALPNPAAVADDFRSLKMEGLARVPEIVRAESIGTPEFRTAYLTRHIRFEFGHREKAGLDRFRQLLAVHGFIAPPGNPLEYV